MNALVRSALVVASAAVMLALQSACARSITDDDSDPLLVAPGATSPAPLTTCVDTACPFPWATCNGGGLCQTDIGNDIQNCGTCGNECPKLTGAQHASSVCSAGHCVYACEQFAADCNLKAYDGCEVDTGSDPKNCGGCGLACKDGDVCWRGACGCPTGFALCGDECRDLTADNLSCGICDKKCSAPPNDDPEWKCGGGIQPDNTTWTCDGGACKMACSAHFGNCNDNLCVDGCETDERTDPKNCGACGHECAANQDCVDGQCLCPPGTVRCFNSCVDVNVDPTHCGSCDNQCPGAGGEGENGSPTCTKGRCGYVCFEGFADCNGRLSDGCEANIGNDPLHCGGCGTQCDRSRNQPCVGGKCLTKKCEPGQGTQ